MTLSERATYDMVALLSNREEKDPKVVLAQVRKAIETGANPNATAMDGVTPLVWVLFDYQDGKAFDVDLVRLLVKKGANPDEVIRVFGSGRPLMKAAANGWLDGVRALLDAPGGLMLDAVDAKERTALHHAVRNGSLPIVQALITAGSPLSMADEDGQTPLHYAAYAGKEDLVRALLEAGSDDTLRNNDGRSALFLAQSQNHVGTAALLAASKNAPLDETDDQGDTALHRAARKGDLAVVEALLKNYEAHYRKVDEKNKALSTPLYLAAETGQLDVVKVLLKSGASVFERGQNNMRPYDVAKTNEQKAVVDFLREPTGEMP
jgi:ankyrin repeat protein